MKEQMTSCSSLEQDEQKSMKEQLTLGGCIEQGEQKTWNG